MQANGDCWRVVDVGVLIVISILCIIMCFEFLKRVWLITREKGAICFIKLFVNLVPERQTAFHGDLKAARVAFGVHERRYHVTKKHPKRPVVNF